MQKRRLEYIDLSKAIAMGLVMVSHSVGPGLFALKLYCMPLFFFLAGLFFKESESFVDFFSKRIKRLYIPFVVYEFVFVLLHNFFYEIGFVSDRYESLADYGRLAVHILLFDSVEILLASMWYVTVLFGASVCIKVFQLIFRKLRHKDVILLVLTTIFLYVGIYLGRIEGAVLNWSVNCPQVLNIILVGTGYMYWGVFSGKHILQQWEWKVPKMRFEVNTVLFAGMLVLERVTRMAADMRSNIYSYPALVPVFAVVGIIFVLDISVIGSWVISKSKWTWAKRLIGLISKYTFEIMCLHPLVFKLVGVIQVYCFGYDKFLLADWGVVSQEIQWAVVYGIAGLILPVGFGILKDKVKIFLCRRPVET